jgi:hypothetical protein
MSSQSKLDFILMMVECQLEGTKKVMKNDQKDGRISSSYLNGYNEATKNILDMIQRTMKAGAENE